MTTHKFLLLPFALAIAAATFTGAASASSLDLSRQIVFASNKSNLDDSAKTVVDQLVIDLMANFSTISSIVITGHTDLTGSKAANDKLSLDRASSVKRYLVSRGFDGRLIRAEGKGWIAPPKGVACDRKKMSRAELDTCHELMRRIDFHIEGAQRVSAGPPLP